MRIGHKSILGFVGIALLVGVVGYIEYYEIGQINKDVKAITEFHTPALLHLSTMKAKILEGIQEAFAYPLLDAQIEKDEFYEKMDEFDKAVDEFKVVAHIDRPGEKEESELFNKIVAVKKALVNSATRMFEGYERNGKVDLLAVEAFEKDIDSLIPLIEQFVEIEKEDVKEAHTDAEKSVATANTIISLIVLIVIVLAIGIGIFTARSISKPVTKLRDAAVEIGRGKLDTKVNIKSNDEIGELAQSFNEMTYKLKEFHVNLEKKVQERTSELTSANVKLGEKVDEHTSAQKTLEQRLKVINCLYDLSKLIERPKISLEQIFQPGEGVVFCETVDELSLALDKIKGSDLNIKTREKVMPYSWNNIAETLGGMYLELTGNTPSKV